MLGESVFNRASSSPGTKVHLRQSPNAPPSLPDRFQSPPANPGPTSEFAQAFSTNSKNYAIRLPAPDTRSRMFSGAKRSPNPTGPTSAVPLPAQIRCHPPATPQCLSAASCYIPQQRQLCRPITMPAHMLDPRPGNRYGATTVGQTDHQQLVRKANLTAILDQPDLLPLFRLTFDLLPGNRFIPFPHHNGRVGQFDIFQLTAR